MRDLFLVDIGNTALKWASRSRQERLADFGYLRHHDVLVTDALEEIWGGLRRPLGVWFASVANPALTDRLAAWVRTRWQLEPREIRTEKSAFGVVNSYRNAGQLGVDRWLALVAARARCRGACCIADLGTAATVDLMNANGEHLGGLILPGIGLSRRALLEYTRIPRVDDVLTPSTPFGRETAAAVALGSRYALAGAVSRAVAYLSAKGDYPKVFVLGSEASAIAPFLDCAVTEAPHLVLEGIGHYAGMG